MRNKIIKNARRIVIKIGTGVLTASKTTEKFGINKFRLDAFVNQIIGLIDQGREVIIITSGAVGIGCNTLGFNEKPDAIPERQAAAAVGQIQLMHMYQEAFHNLERKGHRYPVAQLLLTQDLVDNRIQYLNARNTIFKLLEKKIIPIINENDTVSVEEIRFGDNDNLSAIVAHLVEADLALNLSTVGGLLDNDGRVIPEVEVITDEIKSFVKKGYSKFGTGGMSSKLSAAEKIVAAGGAMIIANGEKDKIIRNIFFSEEENEGTMFFPRKRKLSTKRRWIAYTKSSRGEITVDRGAAAALIKKGTSLLPIGVSAVHGKFKAGDMVKVVNEKSSEIARGLVNYSAFEIKKIKGKKSSEITKILGEENTRYEEVIHRDNLVLTKRG